MSAPGRAARTQSRNDAGRCTAPPASTTESIGALLTGDSFLTVAGTGTRDGRETTSNAVSARAVVTSGAPVGNSIRRR
jgi:hypothetical protein